VPSAPPLDPEFAEILAAIPLNLGELDLDNLPQLRSQAGALTEIELSDRVKRTDFTVPGPQGAPDVTVRVHTPLGLEGPLPCVYSIHGGGFVLGSYEMDDLRHDAWSPEVGYVAVSVEYRLAPETPYPGPLEDCYAGLKWTFGHAGELGIDTGRIGISGISAGGGLAAGLALLVRDRGEMQLAFQCLTYPMLDDRQETVSSRWDDVPIWTPANNAFGWRSYLGGLYGTDAIPAYAVPARAEDLAGLPPTYVCVGTVDGFCDESVEYARRLIDSRVPTELHVYPGAPHGFDAFGPQSAVSQRSHREMKDWLAAILSKR
jgi:acetyl esterase/lipase